MIFTNLLPDKYLTMAYGNQYLATIMGTEDGWFIVKILYLLHGIEYEACGRGRSLKVADKFAKQALKKAYGI